MNKISFLQNQLHVWLLPEMLIVSYKMSCVLWKQRFIKVFIPAVFIASNWTLSWAKWMLSTSSLSLPLAPFSFLILSHPLYLELLSGLFPSLCMHFSDCPPWCDNANLQHSINYEAPHYAPCSNLLCTLLCIKDILLGTLFSEALHILSFLKARDQVSHS